MAFSADKESEQMTDEYGECWANRL